MQPRWDYVNCAGSWSDMVLFLGGTNTFDIYVDSEGVLRLTCGPPNNDNWHWVKGGVGGSLSPVAWSDPSEEWGKLFYEDRRNIEAYLACFAPDWHERGSALHERVKA